MYVTCVNISSLVGRTVCSVPYLYSRLPEDESSGSKHVDDIRKLIIKILIWKKKLHFVALYYVTMHGAQGKIILQCTVHKAKLYYNARCTRQNYITMHGAQDKLLSRSLKSVLKF